MRNLVRHHPYGRRAAKCSECRVETAEADVRPNYLAQKAVTSLLAVRMQWVSLPEGTSLTRQEYYGLVGLMGDHGVKLQSIYRASVHGTTYGDMLRCVGDKRGLVFVVPKGKFKYGAFISAGLELPDDPTDWNAYDCDLWHFSLAGSFPQPTKIDIDREKQYVYVAGREGGCLSLGHGCDKPTADIRACGQHCRMTAGAVGYHAIADDLEVLHVL
ncbi:unnamed protein product [Vitrella brassicaformis CCMP3155]|uniref:TLDc domain-containing protein n=1 Tax=Vitrella brassicaformis (strain CCMP3155) TaxID=1169540 RepID=A0A0G4FK46_VITBC|nr:unnamed protein product [Vitrella brassicaformis CCMP3155]|eukprot:CEM13930.1 unnamed protein product [Vitrella brassicaformis CCMP3155]